MKALRKWWNSYKYRFVPWLAFNLKERSARRVTSADKDKLITDNEVKDSLQHLFSCFEETSLQPQNNSYNTMQNLGGNRIDHNDLNSSGNSQHFVETPVNKLDTNDKLLSSKQNLYHRNINIMEEELGFVIKRQTSIVEGGGRGVVVCKGTVPAGTVVAMYPGAIYQVFEPIFLQSLGNPFIFRCIDGILIDGNDKALSKFIYRSCAQRERMGPYMICDMSWLTEETINPLAIGQYVNNHNKEYPANVSYQEFDVPADFPLPLRKYIPNVFFSASIQYTGITRLCRTVVLISTRTIHQGEELFSSYYTVVH